MKKYALSEHEILKQIQNQFVVKILFSFQTSTHCVLGLEYLPGKDISSYLDKEGCFSENKAKFYICEWLAAIHSLHKKGVLYRDLKPNNVMLDKNGHIKLIDFNLSKSGFTYDLNTTNSFCGSYAYMPPEVIQKQNYGLNIDW